MLVNINHRRLFVPYSYEFHVKLSTYHVNFDVVDLEYRLPDVKQSN